jgi:hypothetical protein
VGSGDPIDIFVSYARPDRTRVMPLVHALEAKGWRIFWDHDIPPGWTWDEYIGARLEEAAIVLVVWSKESVGSEFVRTEAGRARKRRAMVPVRIDEVDPPVEFERVHSADLIEWAGVPQGEVPQALLQELARRLRPSGERAREVPAADAGPKASADEALAVGEKLRQSEAAREALAAELKAVREALGSAGRELEGQRNDAPVRKSEGAAPATPAAAGTGFRDSWRRLHIVARIALAIVVGVSATYVAALVVFGVLAVFGVVK